MRLSIVMPCYNEQEILPHTLEVMLGLMERLVSRGLISDDSYIFLVDDGSRDDTWRIVSETHANGSACEKAFRWPTTADSRPH